jgi:hypothetical protein
LLYARQGRLEQLKQDILAYVMYEERWAPDELQLKRETQRLLSANVVLPKGTFSYLSPHPTVYRADGEGVIEIAGQKFHFDSGQDIVFVPWLARVSWPSLTGPVRIARLQSTVNLCLCCDAFPRVNGLCERALAILRQTLPNGATRQIARY